VEGDWEEAAAPGEAEASPPGEVAEEVEVGEAERKAGQAERKRAEESEQEVGAEAGAH
jgi:hypothetical protein